MASERAMQASDNALTLQVCNACGTVQYPSRSVCRECLFGELAWSVVSSAGRVLATAVVQASLHSQFRERGPWHICSVALDAGPRVLAHAVDEALRPGDAVDVRDRHVGEKQCVLIARRSVDARKDREEQ